MAGNLAEGADPKACEVLSYWFGEDWASYRKCTFRKEVSNKWFMGGPTVDEEIKSQFQGLHATLAKGELDSWLQHPTNAIAGVIVMDQFSRNMFRNTPEMYDTDPKALAWAKHILDTGLCASLPLVMRLFLMLPFEHSEVLADQERCVAIANRQVELVEAEVAAGDPEAPGLAEFLRLFIRYANAHRDVVQKWGRFPHRNKILGRESTPEELEGFAAGTIPSF